MANRFDTTSQAGVGANIQDQRRKDGRVLADLNMAAPLDARTRVSKRKVAEIAREAQEIRVSVLVSELPLTQVSEADSIETVHVFGEVDNTIATKIALDPKLHRKLQAITSSDEAQAWARAERDEGEAPAVRKRQARKVWKGHVTPVSALDADLRASEEDLVELTPNVHAERAVDQTGKFVSKPRGGVAIRRDHATIANPTPYKDKAERRQRERYLAAKAPTVDNIDLVKAVFLGVDAVVDENFATSEKYLVGYDFDNETGSDIPVTLDSETVAKLQNGDCIECEEKVIYVADGVVNPVDPYTLFRVQSERAVGTKAMVAGEPMFVDSSNVSLEQMRIAEEAEEAAAWRT